MNLISRYQLNNTTRHLRGEVCQSTTVIPVNQDDQVVRIAVRRGGVKSAAQLSLRRPSNGPVVLSRQRVVLCEGMAEKAFCWWGQYF